MKLLIITLSLAVLTTSEIPVHNLGQILQSPVQTLKLYSQYKADQHLVFGASENRLRLSVFKRNVQLVSALNSAPEETAEFGLNLFSSMTGEEKKQWLGLNGTNLLPNPGVSQHFLSSLKTPKRLDWVEKGTVTNVENQGSCGSCWAWAAVGAMDTRYKLKSGRLRSFSVQEFLDCSYPDRNGCGGGRYEHAYEWAQWHNGRLAATKDYPYVEYDGDCKGKSTPNAAVAFKIVGPEMVPAGEDSNIAAMSTGALAMALYVNTKFFSYKSGVYKDTTCTEASRVDHGVTGVGYTESYFVIKNSWGRKWGIDGFMRLARNYHNCGLWQYSAYPKLEATGEKDEGKDDKKARYDDEADDGEDDDEEYNDKDDDNTDDDEENDSRGTACKDKYKKCEIEMCKYEKFATKFCRETCGFCEECKDKHAYCEDDFCEFTKFSKDWCQNTCNMCDKGDNDDECNPGLRRCSDGVCRHEHMC